MHQALSPLHSSSCMIVYFIIFANTALQLNFPKTISDDALFGNITVHEKCITSYMYGNTTLHVMYTGSYTGIELLGCYVWGSLIYL